MTRLCQQIESITLIGGQFREWRLMVGATHLQQCVHEPRMHSFALRLMQFQENRVVQLLRERRKKK
jgi:hypothetical protein